MIIDEINWEAFDSVQIGRLSPTLVKSFRDLKALQVGESIVITRESINPGFQKTVAYYLGEFEDRMLKFRTCSRSGGGINFMLGAGTYIFKEGTLHLTEDYQFRII